MSYNTYHDDDGGGEGAGGGGRKRNPPRSSHDGPYSQQQMMIEEDQRKEKRAYNHQQTMNSLHSTYRMGEETLQNQRDVLENLHAQGQTLNNIEEKQARIAANLDKGDKIVKQMTTWKGWFSSLVSGNNSKAEKKKQATLAQLEEEEKQRERDMERAMARQNKQEVRFRGRQKAANPFGVSELDDQDEFLDKISGQVQDMTHISQNIGMVLKDQNKRLDRINENTDRDQIKTRKLNQDLDRMLK